MMAKIPGMFTKKRVQPCDYCGKPVDLEKEALFFLGRFDPYTKVLRHATMDELESVSDLSIPERAQRGFWLVTAHPECIPQTDKAEEGS